MTTNEAVAYALASRAARRRRSFNHGSHDSVRGVRCTGTRASLRCRVISTRPRRLGRWCFALTCSREFPEARPGFGLPTSPASGTIAITITASMRDKAKCCFLQDNSGSLARRRWHLQRCTKTPYPLCWWMCHTSPNQGTNSTAAAKTAQNLAGSGLSARGLAGHRSNCRACLTRDMGKNWECGCE